MDGMPELFPDKVHPNEEGAKVMAKAVYQALKEWNRRSGLWYTSGWIYFRRRFIQSDVFSLSINKLLIMC